MSLRHAATLAASLALAFLVTSPLLAGDDSAVRPLATFPRERIAIETRGARRHLFAAWRADDPQTRAQGLMFVEDLRPDQAMIFVYEPTQRVAMWMKNTLIPLDMLFVDEHGCIVKVHERARPGDLRTIESGEPVVLVVELAGGTAGTLGLRRGDRVTRLEADWPAGDAGPCSAPR